MELFMFDFTDLFSLKENDFLSFKNMYTVKDYSSVYKELFDLSFDFTQEFIFNVLRAQMEKNDYTINPNLKNEKPRGLDVIFLIFR